MAAVEREEAWARMNWLAARGGHVVWLDGPDDVDKSSLIAAAISSWQVAGHQVLFSDLSVLGDGSDGTDNGEGRVLHQLMGTHAGTARSTGALWRRLVRILEGDEHSIRVILDQADRFPLAGHRLVSTLKHHAIINGATVIISACRDDSWWSAVLSEWADLAIGPVGSSIDQGQAA
ncbi:MAG: hypothetical protein VB859_18635 [Planctomycetaceae bacterium]